MMTFLEEVLTGAAEASDIDAWIDAWHEHADDLPIEAFLGMTPDEYALWVEEPDVLPFIISAHQTGRTVAQTVMDADLHAAVGGTGQQPASRILAWLRSTGRV